MRIWNLFEQSGHFKDVEAEMGYDGIDVDCVKTDHTDYVMDLLAEMDKWENKPTKTVDKERGINRSLISKEFIRVFLSEIVDLEGEAVNKKYD